MSWPLGDQARLSDHAPKMFASFLKASLERVALKTLAQKVGDPQLLGRTACLDVARTFLASSSRTSIEAAAVGAATTNCIWTKTRLSEAGYEVDSELCQLCLAEPDTVHHRLWRCLHPPVLAARRSTTTEATRMAALVAGPQSALFNHGIVLHPSEYYPPISATRLQWQVGNNNVHDTFGTPLSQQTVPLPRLEGHVFADGHCSRTGFPSLDRGAFSLVQMTAEGVVQSWIRGNIGPQFMQTPQVAEFMAAMYATDVCRSSAVLYDDCQNVVDQFKQPPRLWGQEKSHFAGVMRTAYEWRVGDTWGDIQKVKAHVNLKDSTLEGFERFLAVGNDKADWHAKEAGRLLNEGPTPEAAAKLATDTEWCKQSLALMAAVLPMWPHARDHKRKAEVDGRRIETQRVPEERRHRWIKGPTMWHCHSCRAYARGVGAASARLPPHREREACPGLEDALAPDAAEKRGHRLVQLQTSEGPFTICGDCGCWGIRRALGLRLPCTHLIQTRRKTEAWRRVF